MSNALALFLCLFSIQRGNARIHSRGALSLFAFIPKANLTPHGYYSVINIKIDLILLTYKMDVLDFFLFMLH